MADCVCGTRIGCSRSESSLDLLKVGQSKLWPPVAVTIVRTDGETRSRFAMPIELFGEPLKPFPRFLRSRALTFIFNAAAQRLHRHASCLLFGLVITDEQKKPHGSRNRAA